jgi:hypothetical protein
MKPDPGRGGGVFAIARKIWSDPDFPPEPFTEREAWMWLIGAAAFREHRVRGGYGPVSLRRGEFCFSTRFLGDKWKWSKDRAARFLLRLKKRDMILDTDRVPGETVYTIRKYDQYQTIGLPNGASKDTERDTERATENAKSASPLHRDCDKEETLETLNHNNLLLIDGSGFEGWWPHYPRKVGKAKAADAFAKALEKAPFDRLLAAVKAYARERVSEDPKFTKHPATWLNGEHWNDYPPPPKEGETGPVYHDEHTRRLRARIRSFQNTGVWPFDEPRPDDPNAAIPKELLKEFGYG